MCQSVTELSHDSYTQISEVDLPCKTGSMNKGNISPIIMIYINRQLRFCSTISILITLAGLQFLGIIFLALFHEENMLITNLIS